MKRLAAFALLLAGPAGVAQEGPDTDPGYEQVPATAFALYEKIKTQSVAPSRLADLVRPLTKKCDYSYTFYLLEAAENPRKLDTLYAIASDGPQRIVFGIHYRFDLNAAHDRVIDTASSSKGCLEVDAIPEGKARPKFTAYPNLVGAPNELHVLVSLRQGYPLVLFDDKSKWLIFGNTIRSMEKQ
jgi:hypothetical protein